MNEEQANAIAEIFSGEAWNSGGDGWLAAYWRGDGKYIVFSSDAVAEYDSDEAFDNAKASNTFLLASGEEEQWVLIDAKGNVFHRNSELKTGWRCQEEANYEAAGLQSRTGTRFFAKELDAD